MERTDIYIAVVVTLMFLAGCIVMVLAARERAQARRRGENR